MKIVKDKIATTVNDVYFSAVMRYFLMHFKDLSAKEAKQILSCHTSKVLSKNSNWNIAVLLKRR